MLFSIFHIWTTIPTFEGRFGILRFSAVRWYPWRCSQFLFWLLYQFDWVCLDFGHPPILLSKRNIFNIPSRPFAKQAILAHFCDEINAYPRIGELPGKRENLKFYIPKETIKEKPKQFFTSNVVYHEVLRETDEYEQNYRAESDDDAFNDSFNDNIREMDEESE